MGDDHSNSFGAVILPSLEVEPGLDVVDPVERLRRTVRTDGPVSPTAADPDEFVMPVESAVEIETARLTLPIESQICVRRADGQMIGEVGVGERESFPEGSYCIEPPWIVKLYVRVDAAVEIRQSVEETVIDFGEPVRVALGACSTHERPAATVTVSEDPEDLLPAVSTFGSALTTTSPERAFPTHRGHPPRVQIGEELDVPEGLAPPEDDLRIEVPVDVGDIFTIAPLTYYLGVPVEAGPVARLLGATIDHPLTHDGDLEAGVQRTLEQVFVLDCITRTEGIYQVDLHERRRFEERFDLPLASLYEAPQPERLAAYLALEYEELADLVPDWKQAAHVEPTVSNATALPYLLDDLSLVKTAAPEEVPTEAVQHGSTPGLVRGTATATTDTTFVTPTESADTIEETWVGDGTPIGASKAIPAAYENRIGRSTSTGSIDIAVVCNDERMDDEEAAVDEVYGSRAELPFEVEIATNSTTEELADLLAADRDFLHYIGHIDDDGFRCSDGRLAVEDVETAGMDAFFLNACQSYEEGVALVEAGAIGGIVTIRDVANYGALQIGKAVARLLNCGFSLRPALDIAREESVIGCHYVVVGDGGLSIVQPESGTPYLCEFSPSGEGFEVTLDLYGAYPGMGGLFTPHIDTGSTYYLASGSVPATELQPQSMLSFLQREICPVRRNEWIAWSNEISLDSA